ncbi:MAG: hypothetical protein V1859_02005 [archaeon]
MNKMYKTLFLALICAIAALNVVYAADDDIPTPLESLIVTENERMNMTQFTAATETAEAGNVTRLSLYSRSQTKHWQGYYGEITGTITLDDAQNWTMYDWNNQEPKGEIYATCNTSGITPDWATVECFDFETNLRQWEIFYNMTTDGRDNINNTFNMTDHPSFGVGRYTIAEDACQSTFTYVNDSWQEQEFREVLLQADGNELIYMTIIEQNDWNNDTDPNGFDNAAHDFQLIVAEDGSSYDEGEVNQNPTVYYFYVDLE